MPSSYHILRQTTLLALAVVVLGVSGCTTEVATPIPAGQVFTLWGQLDPTVDRQAVRVQPITETIDSEPDFDGVTVVSVDAVTGVETVWRDSVVTIGASRPAHVFVADVRPAYGHPVEFQVRRNGQVITYARTTVPPRVVPSRSNVRFGEVASVELVAIGAPRLIGGIIDYVVFPPNNSADVTVESFRIEQQEIRSIDTGWMARAPLSDHIPDILATVNLRYPDLPSRVQTMIVCQVRFRISVVDQDWAAPFPFQFSRPLLLEPGTVSNVRNGYGYVGGAYTLDLRLDLTDIELNRLGLQVRETEPCLAAGY